MNLKKKLSLDEVTLGSWITIPHPAIPEIMSNAGFDWLVIDLEHSSITIREAEDLIRVVDICGKSPLVRLTSNDPDQIKRVMDSGAHGIIVPNITSIQEVEKSFASLHYPPLGKRGVGLARAQKYGSGFDEYLNWQEEGPVLIAQIENKVAIENLDEIFSSGLIDAFIIGPYDLSASMGIPGQFEHPDFLKSVDSIIDSAKKNSIPSGIHIVEPDLLQLDSSIKKGHTFIAYSLDIRMLDTLSRQAINSIKI
tara:strand:- start:3677 stop:4432 length:756 start_codon:yes stop_codon:yes gene_type:complete